MSQLWVRKARAEVVPRSKMHETLNRILPMPFEERRSRVGMVKYRTFRWVRYTPLVIIPAIIVGLVLEERYNAQENVLTALHLWLADHGAFPHDSIHALNPAYEDERRAAQWKMADMKWLQTRLDCPSQRELHEFMAINVARQAGLRS